VIISHVENSMALNLKAPLVIHLAQQAGRQIVARDDHAVQHRIDAVARRKTA
jgi:flagellar assembly factor FliW